MPLLAILFTTSIAYSQTTILSDKGDTLIGFSVNEAKFLLLKVNEVEELKNLNYQLKEQKGDCDYIRIEQRSQINKLESVIKNKDEAMSLVNIQIKGLESDLEKANKRVKRQILLKWAVGIAGASATAYMTYLWANK
jgi:peptidoglycan hydrolase CwlO-like protein